MLEDLEGHRIRLAEGPNGHLLILGQSGYGKSYYCSHRLTDIEREGGSALVIDYSGSYTRAELEKHQVSSRFREMDPIEQEVCIYMRADDSDRAAQRIADALIKTFRVRARMQQKILRDCCEELCDEEGAVPISTLTERLEEKDERARNQTEKTEIKNLRFQLDKLTKMGELRICGETGERPGRPGVDILQLSGFSNEIKNAITDLCMRLLWEDTRFRQGKPRYDAIFLDEFQNLPLDDGGPFEGFLREGRKFGIRLIFSTQYIDNYSQAAQKALKQAGTMLFFHPTPGDEVWIEKLLSQKRTGNWRGALMSLERGQAILYGAYYINEGKNKAQRPIIVQYVQDKAAQIP